MTPKANEAALEPSHDFAAERAVLSAVMLSPAALGGIRDFLRAEQFYLGSHRAIYAAACSVAAEGSPVDEQTVASRLKDRGELAGIGGAGAIAEILEASPAIANVRAHAEVVHERWRQREIVRVGQSFAAQGYRPIVDVQAFADAAAREMVNLARQRPGVLAETNIDTLKRLVREIGHTQGGASPAKIGIPTGIRPYDEATLGLHAGQKTTVVALPRVGKTAFGLQVAMNVARRGIGVLMFSTELTRDELAERQIASLCGVDYQRLRKARLESLLTASEWARMTDGVQSLLGEIKYRLTIHDDVSITAEEIIARSKAHAEQSATDGVPLGLVVVDYVQRLRPSPRFDKQPHAKRNEHIAHATELLKDLARDLMIPVIELAQQKNGDKDASGKRKKPGMGDAAESMQIERSADNVVYLWRPDERNGSEVRALLVKQRAGRETEIPLTFEGHYSRFTDLPPSGEDGAR